jgi:hypothetical protein
MTKEALKQALEALKTAEIDGNCEYGATEIIRKALAQPERTWVGLTEEERINISYKADGNECVAVELTEAKLKEKNFDKK